jgi:hypothetical protein
MPIALSVRELVGVSDWIVFVLMLVLIGLDQVRRGHGHSHVARHPTLNSD